jgi:hypothetical protein
MTRLRGVRSRLPGLHGPSNPLLSYLCLLGSPIGSVNASHGYFLTVGKRNENLPERRRKRYPSDPRLCAHVLVAEGKIGVPRPGAGRPRVPRASEVAAQEIQRHGKLIARAIIDGLRSPSQHVS